MKERINDVRIHIPSLTEQELDAIILDSTLRAEAALREGDIARTEKLRRSQPELPMSGRENYERVLGDAVMRGEVEAPEALEALGRFSN